MTMDTTLELTPKHYKVDAHLGYYNPEGASLKDLRVTRILFFAEKVPLWSMPLSPSNLYVQLDLQQRGKRLEYYSGVHGFDLRRLLSDQKLHISTRMGGGDRAKPRVVTITFGPQLMVWLDEMLQKGFVVPDGKERGGLGAVQRRDARIPTARWDAGTLRVGSTPVLSLEQLRGEVLDTDSQLGNLYRATKNARVWVKGRIVTVQWLSSDGSWRSVSKYRVP